MTGDPSCRQTKVNRKKMAGGWRIPLHFRFCRRIGIQLVTSGGSAIPMQGGHFSDIMHKKSFIIGTDTLSSAAWYSIEDVTPCAFNSLMSSSVKLTPISRQHSASVSFFIRNLTFTAGTRFTGSNASSQS